MSNFYFAKFAALEDIAELIDAGAGTNDVLGAIQMTLDTPIEKFASEEDIEVRLGIESVCYDFLKTASDYYATMNVNCEEEALIDCLQKVAAETGSAAEAAADAAQDAKQSFTDRMKGMYGAAKGHAGKAYQTVSSTLGGTGKYGKKGQAAALLGLGATGVGVGLGAKALYDRRKEQQQQQNTQK